VNNEKKITIQEIAKQAEVSPATVSLVLNGKAGVNEITRKRVLECAKNSKYVSTSFKALRKSMTKRLAVIPPHSVGTMSKEFQSDLYKSIIDACHTYDCDAVYTALKELEGRVELPEIIALREVDGIILLGDTNDYVYNFLNNTGIPIVILDSHSLCEDRLCVYVDYQQAAFTAVHYLIELGHKDIAYIGDEQQHLFNMSVFSGFQEALQQENIALNVNRIQMNVLDQTTFYAAMDMLFKSGVDMPTALFCSSDLPAIMALGYLNEHAIHVPENVSVIGIDDLAISRLIIPSLTTVRVNRVELGRLGVKLLIDDVAERKVSSIILPSDELIIRKSTSAPCAK